MKVREAFEPYITYCRAERNVEQSTVEKYRECFRVWILPWLGERELAEIDQLHVLRLRQAMENRGLSVARRYSIIGCLKGLLAFCRKTLGVPCLDPSTIALPKRPAPNVEYLKDDEIQRVLDGIDTNTYCGIRLRALAELLIATGMRISEALSLSRAPFEADAHDIDSVGKVKRRRTVFFSSRARFWVKAYLKRRVDDNPALFVTTGFPVRPCRREDVSRFFSNLRRTVGLTKPLRPHVLRHTFCTTLRDHGADISIIKDLAGHQNIHTTARYYLGRDKEVLRATIDRCLKYGDFEPPRGRSDEQTGEQPAT